MAEDCARGERLGWQEFVRDYAPIARTLLGHFFPMLAPELDTHVAAVFQRARANDNAWFHQLKFHKEKVSAMAEQYKCIKCGHISLTPGACCGGPMKKVG